MLGRGYGLATATAVNSSLITRTVVPPAFSDLLAGQLVKTSRMMNPGQSAHGLGALRILDWLLTLPEVDPNRIIVVGHSRLGKPLSGPEHVTSVLQWSSQMNLVAVERHFHVGIMANQLE